MKELRFASLDRSISFHSDDLWLSLKKNAYLDGPNTNNGAKTNKYKISYYCLFSSIHLTCSACRQGLFFLSSCVFTLGQAQTSVFLSQGRNNPP